MNGRRTPSIRWKPPLKPCMMHVWCGSGREVTLSLTGKKKRIAHRVSVDQPSLCAVVQSAAAGWRKKIGGGGSFLCAVLCAGIFWRTGTFSVRLNAEGDTPPRRD